METPICWFRGSFMKKPHFWPKQWWKIEYECKIHGIEVGCTHGYGLKWGHYCRSVQGYAGWTWQAALQPAQPSHNWVCPKMGGTQNGHQIIYGTWWAISNHQTWDLLWFSQHFQTKLRVKTRGPNEKKIWRLFCLLQLSPLTCTPTLDCLGGVGHVAFLFSFWKEAAWLLNPKPWP